jgi:hypothetical protein
MTIPRTPGDGAKVGAGISRVDKTTVSATKRTDTSWYAVDGGADLSVGRYELLIRGDSPTDAYLLTWASLTSTEQAALAGTEVGRTVFVNSPIEVYVGAAFLRLSVRSLATPGGAGWTAELAPIL